MIRPLRDQLVIDPIKRVQSEVIEVVSNEKACIGRVIAAGPGQIDKKGRIKPLDVKVGDVIRYGGEEYLSYPEYFDPETLKTVQIITERDVTGVVNALDSQAA